MVHRLKPNIFLSARVEVTDKASADAPREILCERTDGTRSRTTSLRLTSPCLCAVRYCDPGSRVDGKFQTVTLTTARPSLDKQRRNLREVSGITLTIHGGCFSPASRNRCCPVAAYGCASHIECGWWLLSDRNHTMQTQGQNGT